MYCLFDVFKVRQYDCPDLKKLVRRCCFLQIAQELLCLIVYFDLCFEISNIPIFSLRKKVYNLTILDSKYYYQLLCYVILLTYYMVI